MDIRQALSTANTLGLPRLEAQLLLLHSLGRAAHERAWLLAHDHDLLAEPAQTHYLALLQRRVAGEPLAYLTGVKEFYGLRLHVDARVLDPRPDTETLVDWALQCLTRWTAPQVIDLGTGSGAIALALQHHRPDAQVSALDASAEALAVAQANAQRLGLAVRFVQSDWLTGVTGRFALIVSNPPYIAEGDPHLPALAHEPRQALTAGADGLDDLRTIIRQAVPHLAPGGWLLLEHGWDQADAVRSLLRSAGLGQVQSRTDLNGIERCSGGQASGS